MPFTAHRDVGDGAHLVVVEHLGLGLGRAEIDVLVAAVGAADDLELLETDSAGDDLAGFLGHHVGVGLDRSRHHHLALAERTSTTTRSVASVVGSAVKATPERSEAIICWTTTAIAGSAVNPRLAR